MTHTASHIIISALQTNTPSGTKYYCWHYVVVSVLLGFILGALVF